MEPVGTTSLITQISQQGALASFMLLIIIFLVMAVKMLYQRNVDQGADNMKALVDSTVAVTNNTMALGLLTKEIERLQNAK